jgi:tetratricopeptide (TPR) repeat protein
MRLALLLAVVSTSSSFAAPDAPVSLTASDGTGLKLVKLQARAVVADPLAFTELTLTFENPLDRVLEGQFKVTLPQGATVSRFAMKLGARWQEGEVVERQAARRAYEDFLHRRQDPALLEQSGGNEFTARVFPIPARGVKEVVLSYSHELTAVSAPYVLPLKGLPEVGELDLQVSGVEGEGALVKKRFVPSADFSAVPVRHQGGVRSQDLVVARVVPVEQTEADPMSALTVLVDSSGSRALGWRDQVTLVKQVLAELAARTPNVAVSVVAFDQQVAPLYAGPLAGFGDAQAKQLLARRALGASNVELALKTVQARPTARVLLVGDGVFTAGVSEGPSLQALLLKLKAAGVQRLDAIAVGGLRDATALARLTAGSLPRDGAVLDSAAGAGELARRLGLATRSKLEVKVEGATQVWPTQLAGVQAGDAVLVYAQLPNASTALKVTVGGRVMPVSDAQLASIERPLLERAWAKARLEALQARLDQADGPAQREQVKQAIVELSTKSRVLSSLTALLVLETEADYARFRIDRRALADILTVQGGKLAVLKRTADSVALPAKPMVSAVAKERVTSQGKSEGKKADDTRALSADKGSADQGPGASEEQAEVASAPRPAPRGAGGAPSAPAAEPVLSALPANASPPAAAPQPPSAQADSLESPALEGAPLASRERAAGSDGSLPHGVEPYTGTFKQVMDALKSDPKKALAQASGWHEEQPGDLLALVALGEALEASGDVATAARAYGSIIDLFPARADLRRFAGIRLERLTGALELAVDTFRQAAEQRADHPASHRLLAFSLLKVGKPEQAFAAIAKGLAQRYPEGRFAGVDRILREDAGLIAAAWAKAEPQRAGEIEAKLKAAGGRVENEPSLRFVLNWETDANDVDFHIIDARGGHAFYSQRGLPSGGELYADVTTGYGPECFTIRLPPGKRAAPYKLLAHYYSIGPMGAGMGKLQVIEHDGKGGLRFEERPYVVMVNQAFVDLGVVKP